MDLTTYLKMREQREKQGPRFRRLCETCWQPDFSCYCHWVEPFDPGIRFIILIHPIEHKKRIATGRMSHLSLKNSRLIRGVDFRGHQEIEKLLHDPNLHCVMLYPGRLSLNLSELSEPARGAWIPPGKKLTVFVMDGSWGTVRKMVRLSENLRTLPRVCFTPPTPSNFRIRRQPRLHCYSTIEAIHHTIELLGPACGFSTLQREHDGLLRLFEKMVDRQLELAHSMNARPPEL